MAKTKGMSETELSALLDGQIADAVSYEQSELASLRDKALKYREGIMDDLPAETGKSSVVSMDVNDTVSWQKPGLLRIFANSDRVVEFEPTGPEDEEYAAQATDYINYLFMRECGGYKLLLTVLDDGLGLGNGIFMHWWDKSPCYETQTFTGLSDDAFTLLVSDDDVEVIEHTQYADPSGTFAAAQPSPALLGMAGGQGNGGALPTGGFPAGSGAVSEDVGRGDGLSGPGAAAQAGIGSSSAAGIGPVGAVLHDVKIKRTIKTGKLRLDALPPEELLIPRDAKAIDEEISGIGRERTATRSQLIKEGFKRSEVEELPAYSQAVDETAESARDSLRTWQGTSNPDKSMEKVRVYEWFPLVDYDGDGVAERRRVIIGDRTDKTNARKILLNEEWGDDVPFTDIVPDPVAHRRRGRSQFDNAQDIQRIKTVLLRQMLDNLYLSNNPEREVVEGQHLNPDALVNPQIGQVHFVKQPGMIRDMAVPFVADKSLTAIEYIDLIKQGRTGVGRQTMGLDPDALQNQTAEAVRDGRAASETQVEFYARNMAEIGFKRLFSCILKLVVKNQDKPKTIRLRNKWVEMDPRPWNASMDCTVNVGLGAGSKDRDMVMLQAIAGKQEQVMLQLGPDNPLTDLGMYRNTLAKMVEVGGLRSAEQYFKEVTPEAIQQWMQSQGQKPDPKVQELQMKAQMEAQKLQMSSQIETQKLQLQAEIEKVQAQADIATQQKKAESEMALAERRFDLEKQIKLLDAQLKMQDHQATLAFREKEHSLNMATQAQSAQFQHQAERSKAEAKEEKPASPPKRRKMTFIRDPQTNRIMGAEEEGGETFTIVRDPETGHAVGVE